MPPGRFAASGTGGLLLYHRNLEIRESPRHSRPLRPTKWSETWVEEKITGSSSETGF